jgi:catechol 2,3-dioxygenase-like lactoylglutathione lyase family enzyme
MFDDVSHVGVVVDDLDRAIEHYASAFGWRFSERLRMGPLELHAPGEPSGLLPVDLQVAWSVDSAPPLELICGGQETLWGVPRGEHRIHHIGYWVDDIAAAAARARAGGYEPEVLLTADGGRGFGYYRGPGGMRIELIERSSEEPIRNWRGGAPLLVDWFG